MIPPGVARSGPARDFVPQVASPLDVLLMAKGYGSVSSSDRLTRIRAGERISTDEWWHWESQRPMLAQRLERAWSLTTLAVVTDYSDLPASYTLPDPEPNPGEIDSMTADDMRRIMTERFGPDPLDWTFVCPACETRQSSRDLDPLGTVAKGYVGRVCINAYRLLDDPQRCTWTALTPAGGPMTVRTRTTYGTHAQPSMQIAPGDQGGTGG